MLGDKIVFGMNAWSFYLTESITKHLATHLYLQYIYLESKFIRLVPVIQTVTINWVLIVYPNVVWESSLELLLKLLDAMLMLCYTRSVPKN